MLIIKNNKSLVTVVQRFAAYREHFCNQNFIYLECIFGLLYLTGKKFKMEGHYKENSSHT